MTEPAILTRAPANDESELTLRLPSPPSSTSSFTSPPSQTPSSSPIDQLWGEYSDYLDAARAQQSLGLDILPAPRFVVKATLAARSAVDGGREEGDKLFINVCTHEAVDAPEVMKEETATAPAGSLRVPMSVGPLGQSVDRSGQPCLCVDVVVHPEAVELTGERSKADQEAAYQLALQQAELIARRDGVAPTVPTPAALRALTLAQLRRTVASIALGKLAEKYQLQVDSATEPRFPKLLYKGALPPPAQRIRRNPNNPLHNTQTAAPPGKSLIEVLPAPPAAPSATAAPITNGVDTAIDASTAAVKASVEVDADTEAVSAGKVVEEEAVAEEKQTESPVESTVTAAVTPRYELSTEVAEVVLHVHLPGVASSAAVDASVTSSDVRLLAAADSTHPAYSLHVQLPHPVDDARVAARFNKKRCVLTLRLPLLHATTALQPHTADSSDEYKHHPVQEEKSARDVVSADTKAQASAGAAAAPTESAVSEDACATPPVDWVARLGLRNSLITQTCI